MSKKYSKDTFAMALATAKDAHLKAASIANKRTMTAAFGLTDESGEEHTWIVSTDVERDETTFAKLKEGNGLK